MKKIFTGISLSLLLSSTTKINAQRVGINNDGSSADPSAILDVKSTSYGMLIPRMTTLQRTSIASPAQGLLVFDNQTNSFWFYKGAVWTELAAGGPAINYWSANGANIFKNNSGNVGIGTANPVNKLQIGSSPDFSGNDIAIGNGSQGMSFHQSATSNWYTNTKFVLLATGSGTGNVGIGTANPVNKLQIGSSPDFSGNDIAIGNGTQGMSFHQSATSNWYTNTKFVLLATGSGTGYVGLGTANPVNKLQIGSSPDFSGNDIAIGNGTQGMSFHQSATSNWYTNTNFVLLATGSGTGNVGIGTANPTNKLSVNGDIRSREIIVETAGWPDYVFQHDYSLLPLNKLEDFINSHGHLPNIPSAEEIEKTGLHLGDIQKRMMEKIEELTLYVIELKKEIDLLKK